MNKIFKYKLELTDIQILRMPKDASILSAQFQFGTLFLWALVDPDKDEVERRIRIIGTGHPIDNINNLSHIDTVQQAGGTFIWHVFEEWR